MTRWYLIMELVRWNVKLCFHFISSFGTASRRNTFLTHCGLVMQYDDIELGRHCNCSLYNLLILKKIYIKMAQAFEIFTHGIQGPWGWFNIKMPSHQYRNSHCGDKTILRPSYLRNGISYTGKTTSLYWIRVLFIYIVNTMAAGVLETPGARSSAAIVLT